MKKLLLLLFLLVGFLLANSQTKEEISLNNKLSKEIEKENNYIIQIDSIAFSDTSNLTITIGYFIERRFFNSAGTLKKVINHYTFEKKGNIFYFHDLRLIKAIYYDGDTITSFYYNKEDNKLTNEQLRKMSILNPALATRHEKLSYGKSLLNTYNSTLK